MNPPRTTSSHGPTLALRLLALLTLLLVGSASAQSSGQPSAQPASLALAGLRTAASHSRLAGIQTDATGDLYLLLDQQDGIRLLKTDASASTLLFQAHLGASGDAPVALALDPSGNVYVTGTTSSGALVATSGTAFPAVSGAATSFVARFDTNLTPLWLTFTGSNKMAATALAATASGVFVTGSIFAATLPVTPSAILQAPSFGSLQNGFVEKFDPTGTTLLYATYLTGASGDTSPTAIAADTAGDAYVVGYTTASGYPTLAALVPNILPNTLGATSGFLTKLTPAADGLVFSTFIPGSGLASIALDPATQTLLLTGNLALGEFPVATVQSPVVPLAYQALLRMPLDGSSVQSSTLLAPGTYSTLAAAPVGNVWVAGDLTLPLLPTASLSSLGDAYVAHLPNQSTSGQTNGQFIDQTARFGGIPSAKSAFSSIPITLAAVTTDLLGQPTLVGSVTPQASVSLIPTERYDLPLFNAPNGVLPALLHDAIPSPANCIFSLCPGSAAYLVQLTNNSVASLALASDTAPNLTLRNLGSAAASNLTLTSPSLTFATNCASTLAPGGECSVVLTSPGPGSLQLQATNASSQTYAIPAYTAAAPAVVVSPKELDFGVQASASAPATRTLTVTNLTAQPQTFTSRLDTTSRTLPYTLAESFSDCGFTGPTTKLLAAGASCHIALALTASNSAANDTLLRGQWLIGTQDILLTGYTQAASLSLSAAQVDFGTQYSGGLRLPRYLYLSNSSDAVLPHARVTDIAPFTLTDRCPSQLQPASVCQIQIDYHPTQTPANDSTTLTLDQGLSALLTGQSLPAAGTTGTSVNPNLTVSPAILTFANAVAVTSPSPLTQTVTLTNTGSNAFPITLNLTGDFTETTNCPALLPGNSSCSVVVTFTPTQPGARQGLLSITAGTTSSPVYVNLFGTGTAIFPANNGTLDLGSVPIGQPAVQWYKISQSFPSFSATTSGDFTAILVEDTGFGHGQPASSSFTSNPSGACFNCWVGVQFIPTAVGLRNATLALASSVVGAPYTLALTGTGQPHLGLILTPSTQDFGSVAVGSVSATQSFTLTNLTSNATPVTLAAPSLSGDFTLSATKANPCAVTLSANASCNVEIAFVPSATGQRSGNLTLATSAGAVSAALSGYGLPTANLSLAPTALLFRNVAGPTATVQTITLTNSGTATLQLTRPSVATASFAATTNCAALAPAATCTVTVTFFPGNANVTDTLQIPTSATLSGSTFITTYSVPLSGNYTVQTAGLQITPSQANFGPSPTGALGATRQFTVANLTAKSLALTVSLPRQFVLSGSPCSGLAPNDTCDFSVAFLPLTNGDIPGSLFAQANPTDNSATLNAIGYVEGFGGGAGTLTVVGPLTPSSTLGARLLDFAQVASGQTLARTLTVTNTGNAPLTVRRITTQWPFLSASTCGQTLTPQQSCTVTVTYAPLHQLASGTASPLPSADAGVLTLESDALSSPDLIDLTGTAAPELVAAPANTAPLRTYTASQNSLTFAATAIGNQSVPQSVTLSNTGTVALNLLSALAPSDFSVTNPCTTILPGASCTLSVIFTPQATGTRIAALQLRTDSSSSLDFISLIGAANPSLLTLTPAALDFGPVNIGASSTLPLTLTNTASTAASLQSLSTTGDYALTPSTCPASGNTLAPTASCTLQVTFTPTQTGTRSGVFTLASSATSQPITANLTGTGVQSRLQITPSPVDFGTVATGSSSTRTLTLTNVGNAAITGLSFTLPGGDFSITSPCGASTLAVGATCSLTLSFAPSAAAQRSATLILTSSASSSPDSVSLIGSGLSNGSFTLTVNGGSSASANVQTGLPASFPLVLTPLNGYTGTVVFTCAATGPSDSTTCTVLPASIDLNGTPQNAAASIQTVLAVTAQATPASPPNPRDHALTAGSHPLSGAVLCLLTPTLFVFWRRPCPTHYARVGFWTLWLVTTALVTLSGLSGCGNGADPNLRYSGLGNHQFRVTANATSGVPLSQSVTLNLNVQPR